MVSSGRCRLMFLSWFIIMCQFRKSMPPIVFTKQKFLPRSQAPLVRLVPSSTKNPVIFQFLVSREDFPDSMDPSHHCSAWFRPFFHVSSENIPIVPISHKFLQYFPHIFRGQVISHISPIHFPKSFQIWGCPKS